MKIPDKPHRETHYLLRVTIETLRPACWVNLYPRLSGQDIGSMNSRLPQINYLQLTRQGSADFRIFSLGISYPTYCVKVILVPIGLLEINEN